MATSVVSGRVDETIRQRADVVMRRAGLKPTDVIQGVWAFMARTGEIPDIAQPASVIDNNQEALARLNDYFQTLPSANPAYAGLSDDDILSSRVRDHV